MNNITGVLFVVLIDKQEITELTSEFTLVRDMPTLQDLNSSTFFHRRNYGSGATVFLSNILPAMGF